MSTFEDYERKVVEIALRRQAQPDRTFSTRVGSLFNQAMRRVVHPEPDEFVVGASHPMPVRHALQLTHHRLGEEAHVVVSASGLMLPANVDAHFAQLRRHLLGRQQGHTGFWAFLSDAQLLTCGLDTAALENLVLSHGSCHDMLMFNPFWDVSAFHLNPFLLAEQATPGVLEAAQVFVDALGLGVNLNHWVSCSDTFLVGLNFVAKRHVWLNWMELVNKLLLSHDSRVAEYRDVLYALSGNFITMTNAASVHALDPFNLPALTNGSEKILEQAMACDALKASHVRSGHERFLTQHAKLAVFWHLTEN